jgi:serine/threonine-protein kinase
MAEIPNSSGIEDSVAGGPQNGPDAGPQSDDDEPDLVGTVFGKYRAEELIGRGGMGSVYRAVHLTLGGQAAVKVLNASIPRNSNVVRRFFNEARAAAALKHGGIVEVFDFDQLDDGRPYVLMEYLEGCSLHARLKKDRVLPPAAAVPILVSVCSAVGAAHRAHIVHRDLKPDNIFLVSRAGLKGVVKVLDFGIAKISDGGRPSERTQTGQIFGTPEYMSPEQAFGKNALIGPASDIYSLGIIAYQMLCGTVPFPVGDLSFGDLMNQHAHSAPTPLRERRPEIPRMLDSVVMRALAKDIGDRWPSMDAFAQALSLSLDPSATEGQLQKLAVTDPFGQTTPPEGITPPEDLLSSPTLPTPSSNIPSAFPIAKGGRADEHVAIRPRRKALWIVAGAALVVVAAGAAVIGTALHGRSATPAPIVSGPSPPGAVVVSTPAPPKPLTAPPPPVLTPTPTPTLSPTPTATATPTPTPSPTPVTHAMPPTPQAQVTHASVSPPPKAPVPVPAPPKPPGASPTTTFDPESVELPPQ